MNFKYYSGHGVVEVKVKNKTHYTLRSIDTGMIIKVPINSDYLRDLISKEEVNDVLRIVKTPSASIEQTSWNRRYRDNMEKLRDGSAFQVAEVLRDLVSLGRVKDLSFGERKMVSYVKNLLNTEIRAVTKFEDFNIEMEMSS